MGLLALALQGSGALAAGPADTPHVGAFDVDASLKSWWFVRETEAAPGWMRVYKVDHRGTHLAKDFPRDGTGSVELPLLNRFLQEHPHFVDHRYKLTSSNSAIALDHQGRIYAMGNVVASEGTFEDAWKKSYEQALQRGQRLNLEEIDIQWMAPLELSAFEHFLRDAHQNFIGASENFLFLVRLLPNGDVDRGFGKDGWIFQHLGKNPWDKAVALLPRAQGGLWYAVSRATFSLKDPRLAQEPDTLLLFALNDDGSVNEKFGQSIPGRRILYAPRAGMTKDFPLIGTWVLKSLSPREEDGKEQGAHLVMSLERQNGNETIYPYAISDLGEAPRLLSSMATMLYVDNAEPGEPARRAALIGKDGKHLYLAHDKTRGTLRRLHLPSLEADLVFGEKSVPNRLGQAVDNADRAMRLAAGEWLFVGGESVGDAGWFAAQGFNLRDPNRQSWFECELKLLR